MSEDVSYHLNAIGTKLQNNSSSLNVEDIGLMKNIVEWFHQVWKWWKLCPELGTELGGEMFRYIFNDMLSEFCSDSMQVDIRCDYCDIEYPLLNADPLYTYEMHVQTPEHIKIVSTFKEFESLSTNEVTPKMICETGIPIARSAPNPPNMTMNTSNCYNDEWIRIKNDLILCDLCSVRISDESCIWSHITGKKHRNKVLKKYGISLPPNIPDSSSNESIGSIASIAEIYRSSDERRLAYFFNKICIFFHPVGEESYFVCGLCNSGPFDETRLKVHLSTGIHKARVNKKIEKIDPKRVSFRAGIFIGVGKQGRRCHLCDAKLPVGNYAAFYNHMESESHKKKAIAHYKSPYFKDWEKGITLVEGNPHCVLCDLDLPTKISMQKHVYERAHRDKFR